MPGVRIRYEVHDPSDGESGLAWLAAKAFRRHGYDLLPAVQWLEETGSTRLDAYAQTFATQAALLVESKLVLPSAEASLAGKETLKKPWELWEIPTVPTVFHSAAFLSLPPGLLCSGLLLRRGHILRQHRRASQELLYALAANGLQRAHSSTKAPYADLLYSWLFFSWQTPLFPADTAFFSA